MRDIKFRAWGPQSRVMLEWGDIKEELNDYIGHYSYKLMQYTGLKDKNGRDIYEGDILSIDKGHIVSVVYEAPEFKPNSLFADMKSFETCTVVGNIYENPELLNGK